MPPFTLLGQIPPRRLSSILRLLRTASSTNLHIVKICVPDVHQFPSAHSRKCVAFQSAFERYFSKALNNNTTTVFRNSCRRSWLPSVLVPGSFRRIGTFSSATKRMRLWTAESDYYSLVAIEQATVIGAVCNPLSMRLLVGHRAPRYPPYVH